uniref:Uncharacterized protein n=1 Tax=Gasterosteus aculeatus TaxID=69293 RepID=G3PG86_GASAC
MIIHQICWAFLEVDVSPITVEKRMWICRVGVWPILSSITGVFIRGTAGCSWLGRGTGGSRGSCSRSSCLGRGTGGSRG